MRDTEYCLGFAFSPDNKIVALIKKNRPVWQKGKWNGIGGHLENTEIGLEAMIREFKEETGFEEYSFFKFAELDFKNATVHCYKANLNLDLLSTNSDETVGIFPVDKLPNNLVNDVRWLITLARDTHNMYEIKIIN